MKIDQERRLAQFVDRADELENFCELLETKRKPIITVSGDSGLGKTSLLARMINECARRNLRRAQVVWTDLRNHDYLAIMRKIRDDVGVDYFKRFTHMVNCLADPSYNLKITLQGASSIADYSQFTNSAVRDMANVIIKDSMLVIPRTGSGVTANECMIHLTDQFIADLATATENIPLVVFFDAAEKMTEQTRTWVWDELVQAVADGSLSNILFVLCGRNKFEYNAEIKMLVEEIKLKPLGQADMEEYLVKRGIQKGGCADVAEFLWAVTDGNPRQMAVYVDAYLLKRGKRRAEPFIAALKGIDA
jgi:hypothetical protein